MSVTSDVDPRQLIGAVLSVHYQLTELVRDDATAATFMGVNTATGGPVVVKLVKHELVDDGAFAQPYLKTLRGLCGLAHPNIIDVLDYGNTEDGAIYVIAEHDQSDPLTRTFERTLQFDWPKTRAIGLQLVKCLRAAHARGAVHRALRPNCCVVGGEDGATLRVGDFGLIRPRVSDSSAPGEVMHYLAPEIVLGEDADARVDIYGIGALMYRMLEGRPPVSGKLTQVSMQHGLGNKFRVRKRSGVTPAVIALMGKALARKPAERYANMAEFEAALTELGEHGFKTARAPAKAKGDGVTPIAGGEGPTQGSAVFYSLDSLRGSLADAKTPEEKLEICDKIERALVAMGGKPEDVATAKWRELLATSRAEAGEERSKKLRTAKRWKELADVLEQRVEQCPSDRERVPLLVELGQLCAKQLADLSRARASYERLIQIFEALGDASGVDAQTQAETWLAIGRLFIRTGHHSDGIAAVDYYLQQHPSLSASERADQLNYLAKVFEDKLGDQESAIARLTSSLEVHPGQTEAAHRLVALLKPRGEYTHIVCYLEHIVRHETSSYRRSKSAAEAAVIFHEMLNEPDKAIVMYELAMEHDPENLEIGSSLANLYIQTGNAGNAAPILDLLVRRIDKLGLTLEAQLELCLRAAQTQAALGRREPALKLFRRARALAPDNRGAVLGEADVLFEAKRWDAAYACYRSLITPTKTPQSGRSVAAVYWRLSQINTAQGESEGALKYLKKAVSLDPKDPVTLHALLELQTKSGDDRGMAKTLGQLAKIGTDSERFGHLRQLGEIQRDRLKQPEKALETFEKAAEIDADDVPLLLAVVELHRKRKAWPGV
ncbi:MAG: protein kinase domain-containing protein, partial [Nannocystaceae bacterium]